MDLSTPISQFGVSLRLNAKKLEKLGISTLQDLLYFFPTRYDDLRLISPIGLSQAGEVVTVQGIVQNIHNTYARNRFQIQKVIVSDDSGEIECVWFNQPFITRILKIGSHISISGKVEQGLNKKTLKVKNYEVLDSDSGATLHTGALVPVYHETRGLTSKWIRGRVREVLNQLDGTLQEYLPDIVLQQEKLMPLDEALEKIHFPKDLESAEIARRRFAFEELLLVQLAATIRRREWNTIQSTVSLKIEKFRLKIKKYINSLPFTLTKAQQKAVESILEDLSQKKPMNRLLEGDVGSGKTVVASVACYVAFLNGKQTAFMAPTEILAQQHFQTLTRFLEPMGVKIQLFTSTHKKKDNNEPFDIAVGTHALLNETITFDSLGLVVIDEQQRFGVNQRGVLRDKGQSPHFLTMTATPIPRTVLLTLYGDLDLSYLDELPSGRKKVKTWLVPNEKRLASYEWIKQKINEKDKNGHKNQVFIVCPFIEESESMTTVKAAKKEFEYLKNEVFIDFSVGLLHGKIKNKEKQEILDDFHDGKLDILVATPVVEVGIDIPNATVMLIEAADRFGLAQLHQLRGRVGRSDKQSFCLLFSESESASTRERLKGLETMYLGAELAEFDLKRRGPGDMYGTQQHGINGFKVASYTDFDMIEKTKQEALGLVDTLSSYPLLQDKVKQAIIQRVNPD
jgi:ATP-dependent DNA helicase RecG